MAFNIKLYFSSSPKHVVFYDSRVNNVSGGNITFRWSSNGINTTMSIDEFKRNGFKIENKSMCEYMVEISSDTDILVGNSAAGDVYRVDGYLPYFSKNNKVLNFDRTVMCMFNTRKVIYVSSNLLQNFGNATVINYLFSDHREWRSVSDSSTGSRLEEIPSGFLSSLSKLKELNGFMCRQDNILSIPSGLLNNLTQLKSIRAFNDCKKLSNIVGARITSKDISSVIMLNNLANNCFVHSSIINSGGSGSIILYMFNGCDTSNKLVSFSQIVNVPNKSVTLITELTLDISKVSSNVIAKNIDFGRNVVKQVGNDTNIVDTWVAFMNSKVIPNLRNNGDYSDVKHIYTISL